MNRMPTIADLSRRAKGASSVLATLSSWFADGEEFGFGAEIGISTQKLHAQIRWDSAG
jgi:gamma-glutamyl phosphate reductase